MTLSEAKQSELWDKLEWYALTHNEVRSDIATLLKFRDSDEAYNPLYLFWNMYQPEVKDDDGNFSPAPSLRLEDEQIVLDALELLIHRYRVPYEPDANVSDLKRFFREYAENPDSTPLPDALKNLLILLHVLGARAFRMLKSENGYSEETRECLAQVERTFSQLCYTGFSPSMCLPEDYDTGRFEIVAVFKSALSVTSLSFVELARIHNLDGNPSDGLRYFTRAHDLYDHAMPTPAGIEERWPLGIEFSSLKMDSPVQSLDSFVTWMGLAVSLSELTKTWQLIRASASSITDWTHIANDCRRMKLSEVWKFHEYSSEYEEEVRKYDALGYENLGILIEQIEKIRIEDGTKYRLTWGEYWESAMAWASAQLSPSEYRKLREEDAKTEAENRLKNYFFSDTWNTLPGQAQERLITADVNWNSKQRVSREAILNDLLRATEAMCYRLIWQPLADIKNGSLEILNFLKRDSEIAEDPRRSQPEVREFIWVCSQPFFLEFIEQQNLSDDVVFLTEDLPASMNQLANVRGAAEHDTGDSTTTEVIESAYQVFLGIGRPGILPELARIGCKLQPTRFRRRTRH